MSRGCRPDLLAVMVLAGAVALPVPVLEATPDAPGRPRLARLVAPGDRVELTYRHSMFDIPVRERFEVDARLRLVLEEIRSTRDDIVSYYDIPDAAVRIADGDVRLVRLGLVHERLRVRATAIGDRSLVVDGCAVPLRTLAGEGGALTLAVRWRPAAAAVLPLAVGLPGYKEAPCPNPA